MTVNSLTGINTFVHQGRAAEVEQAEWRSLRQRLAVQAPSYDHRWLAILRRGLGHVPYCLEARSGDRCVGLLPLCLVKSLLFGRFLVGMPYLNVGGVMAESDEAAAQLVDRARALADQLDVKHLELRHECRVPHGAFNRESSEKVHMRLALPADPDALWRRFDPKVRNQIRKAEKHALHVSWGGLERLDDFYRVFSVNMRDLGTPVFGRRLFAAILEELDGAAEICVVADDRQPLAAGLLICGGGVAELPSASSLRRFNPLNGNMLLYWSLLRRAIERSQQVFDFGRSSAGSNTYRFKAQWGAEPHPAIWQYYVRRGSGDEMRPTNPKQQRRIAVWKKLPVWLTRIAGPSIVRGIP